VAFPRGSKHFFTICAAKIAQVTTEEINGVEKKLGGSPHLIGSRTVKTVMYTISVVDIFKKSSHPISTALWRRNCSISWRRMTGSWRAPLVNIVLWWWLLLLLDLRLLRRSVAITCSWALVRSSMSRRCRRSSVRHRRRKTIPSTATASVATRHAGPTTCIGSRWTEVRLTSTKPST